MPDGAIPAIPGPTPFLDAVERYSGTITDIDFGIVWSADMFARAREALTAKLASLGISSGDRVAVAVSNGPQFIAAYVGILACDASPLLLHSKTPPGELHRYAQRFGVQFVVSEPEDENALAAFARPLGSFEFGPKTNLIISRFNVDDSVLARMPLRGVPMCPTSGSTGAPKIALRPGPSTMACALRHVETLGAGPGDRIFGITPMSHSYGHGMSVGVPLVSNAHIISTRNFSVQSCISAIREQAPTILPFTPAILDALVLGRVGALTAPRFIFCAGAALTHTTMERFRQHTGAFLHPAYGTTEAGGIAIGVAKDETLIDGRIGPAMKGMEAETRPINDGSGAETLWVRSTSTMWSYLDEHDQLIDPTIDGWFSTGDLTVIEPNGNIALRGRDSEVINLAGLKVVPYEVEEAISALAGVLEVKVYRGQHAFGQSIVKAAVAVRDGVTEAQIREHCKQQLVYYKRPHTVQLVARLPRTPVGKVDVKQLP